MVLGLPLTHDPETQPLKHSAKSSLTLTASQDHPLRSLFTLVILFIIHFKEDFYIKSVFATISKSLTYGFLL